MTVPVAGSNDMIKFDAIKLLEQNETTAKILVYFMLTASLHEYLTDKGIKFKTEPKPIFEKGHESWLSFRKFKYHVMTIEYPANKIQELLTDWLVLAHQPEPHRTQWPVIGSLHDNMVKTTVKAV